MIWFANPKAYPENAVGLMAGALEAKRLHSLIGARFFVKQRLP
jgi:hypothetical protein